MTERFIRRLEFHLSKVRLLNVRLLVDIVVTLCLSTTVVTSIFITDRGALRSLLPAEEAPGRSRQNGEGVHYLLRQQGGEREFGRSQQGLQGVHRGETVESEVTWSVMVNG